MNSTRSKVLSCFKTLHQTRKKVFAGDNEALIAGRQKINEEFRKNKDVEDTEKIEELVKLGDEVSQYLNTTVIQAAYNENKDVYEVKLTKETAMLKNIPYDPDAPSPKPKRRSKTCEEKE